MSVRAPVGPINFSTQKICIGRGLAAIRPRKRILSDYLFNFLLNIQNKIKGNGGAVFDSINRKQIQQLSVHLPPLKTQKQIVVEIEKEQKSVEECKKLIEIHERKIKDKISEVWGE